MSCQLWVCASPAATLSFSNLYNSSTLPSLAVSASNRNSSSSSCSILPSIFLCTGRQLLFSSVRTSTRSISLILSSSFCCSSFCTSSKRLLDSIALSMLSWALSCLLLTALSSSCSLTFSLWSSNIASSLPLMRLLMVASDALTLCSSSLSCFSKFGSIPTFLPPVFFGGDTPLPAAAPLAAPRPLFAASSPGAPFCLWGIAGAGTTRPADWGREPAPGCCEVRMS
mmetsp:Transcript_29623/g.75048  ORF Transcript_29623/g.75048 Transcript_29623/m.75048 type:complete len:226 (+) Transcript_29623:572-1249(+)